MLFARVVKLVDAGDSKSPAARRAGSIPAPGTTEKYKNNQPVETIGKSRSYKQVLGLRTAAFDRCMGMFVHCASPILPQAAPHGINHAPQNRLARAALCQRGTRLEDSKDPARSQGLGRSTGT